MNGLTIPQLIMLDSLWVSSAKLEWMFFCEEAYVDTFNMPWHGLIPSTCYLALADLVERNVVDVWRDNAPDATGARVGLTNIGGGIWEDVFVRSIRRYINCSSRFLEETNEWINEFECVDEEVVGELHSR